MIEWAALIPLFSWGAYVEYRLGQEMISTKRLEKIEGQVDRLVGFIIEGKLDDHTNRRSSDAD